MGLDIKCAPDFVLESLSCPRTLSGPHFEDTEDPGVFPIEYISCRVVVAVLITPVEWSGFIVGGGSHGD